MINLPLYMINYADLMSALKLMGFGMVGIFIVMFIIFLVIFVFAKIDRVKSQKGRDN